KALFFARAHGFDALRSIRFVFSWRPSNYELLLADALVSNRSDALTEWISILFYVLFVLSAVALSRRWWGSNLRALAGVALVTGLLCGILLGGADYVSHALDRFHRAEIVTSPAPDPSDRGYGDWANLWKGPYVLLTESFSPSNTWLRVPWSEAPWPRYRYEMYYSELGVPFALCAVALPFCIWRTKPQARREALLITAIAFATFAAILPVRYFPSGLFLMALPRFVLFVAPIVFAWTLPPLMRRRLMANVLVVVAAMIFVFYAVENAAHDAFVPFDYVVWASENRGARLPPHARVRAATAVLDLVAVPRDHVAMDPGTTSLLYL